MQPLLRLRSYLTRELWAETRHAKELSHHLSYAEDSIERRALTSQLKKTKLQIRRIQRELQQVNNLLQSTKVCSTSQILPKGVQLGNG